MLASHEQVELLASIFKRGTPLHFAKNEYVIRPGETEPYVYYIESGLIKSFVIDKYGNEDLLILRKPGEIFPLVWVVVGENRDIIYEALSPAVLWRIDRKTCLEELKAKPELQTPLLDMVTDFYRFHAERIMNLGYGTVRERMSSFLLSMAKRFGRQTKEGLLIDAPLRHSDFGGFVNASRETATRTLQGLEKKGLISQNEHYITIKDADGLRAFLE